MPWICDVAYPGVVNVRTFSYTTSVGISPGPIDIVCHPASTPALGGTVVFGVTDGVTTKTIELPGCFLDEVSPTASSSDRVLKLRLWDRRWRWAERFPIDGHFNQQDDHRKLTPWSVASPYQMAVRCLTKMGEAVPAGGWETVIDLPGGLANPIWGTPASYDAVIDPIDDYLKSGTNFTRSRTNPATLWTKVPAAVALAQLCEQFGRFVVLDPHTNTVSIVRYGVGGPMPAGRLISDGYTINPSAVPSEVTVAGSATRYQVRLRTRGVARDWDTSWQPHDRVSYAPELPAGQKMVVDARPTPYSSALDYTLVVNGVSFTCPTTSHSSESDVVTFIANLINMTAFPAVAGKVTAAAAGVLCRMTGFQNGYEFRVRGEPLDNWQLDATEGPIPDPIAQIHRLAIDFTDTGFTTSDGLGVTVNGTPYNSTPGGTIDDAVAELADLISAPGTGAKAAADGTSLNVNGITAGLAIVVTAVAAPPGAASVEISVIRPATTKNYGFHRSPPGSHPDVRPSTRQTYEECRTAAKESVFCCYQVVCENPADASSKEIPIPTLSPALIRHMLTLTGSRVEQVEPSHGDTTVIDPRTTQPYAQDQYNGYSHDRDLAAFGSMHIACWNGLHYRVKGGIGPNTADNQRVYVPFQVIDPIRQVVRFQRPIYRVFGSGAKAVFLPVDPVIEIGVYVSDPANLAPLRFEVTVSVPGATAPPVTRVYEDVQQEIIGLYDADHNLVGFRLNDEDPAYRATLYATEIASRYQTPDALVRGYNNIELVPLDGLIRQIQWTLNREGFSTIASANDEFSKVVLPLGERRRLENETPDAQRASENLNSNPVYRELPKNAAQAVFGGFPHTSGRII